MGEGGRERGPDVYPAGRLVSGTKVREAGGGASRLVGMNAVGMPSNLGRGMLDAVSVLRLGALSSAALASEKRGLTEAPAAIPGNRLSRMPVPAPEYLAGDLVPWFEMRLSSSSLTASDCVPDLGG